MVRLLEGNPIAIEKDPVGFMLLHTAWGTQQVRAGLILTAVSAADSCGPGDARLPGAQ
jgi:hypothetical protein